MLNLPDFMIAQVFCSIISPKGLKLHSSCKQVATRHSNLQAHAINCCGTHTVYHEGQTNLV